VETASPGDVVVVNVDSEHGDVGTNATTAAVPTITAVALNCKTNDKGNFIVFRPLDDNCCFLVAAIVVIVVVKIVVVVASLLQ
jgi:hypothetical protein